VKLPNAEQAFIDPEKLRRYALDPAHRVGQHKARLFATLLDLGMGDADDLRSILLNAGRTLDADLVARDEHGDRYRLDFTVREARLVA